MRFRLSSLALAVLLAGGCTAPKVSAGKSDAGSPGFTAGSASVPTGTSAAPHQACRPTDARLVWRDVSREQVVTGAIRMVLDEDRKRSYAIAKKETSRKVILEGVPAGPGWSDWINGKIAERELPLNAVPSSDLNSARRHLKQLKKADTYIGYVGGVQVDAPFSITCNGLEPSSGRLITWENHIFGLLQCSRRPAANSPGALAKKYC